MARGGPTMRIVTFNANGLRPRVQQFGCLGALLAACGDADIVCIQETKLVRQDVREDVAVAPGFEAVFSFNRAIKPRRLGYSGVATFFRLPSAQNGSTQAGKDSADCCTDASRNKPPDKPHAWRRHSPLALAAEDGFTGLLAQPSPLPSNNARLGSSATQLPVPPPTDKDRADQLLGWIAPAEWEALGFDLKGLRTVDNEGRCVITHHATFVLFNVYMPRVACGDEERLHFKLLFLRALQTRFQRVAQRTGKAIIVAGDFNIVPGPEDSCFSSPPPSESAPDPCRQWLRGVMGVQEASAEASGLGTGAYKPDPGSAGGLLPAIKSGVHAGDRRLPLSSEPVLGAEDSNEGESEPERPSPMADIFRALHPNRREAYTCWSQATGAEEFNFGCRIDLFLAGGPCQCARYIPELITGAREAPTGAEAGSQGPSGGQCMGGVVPGGAAAQSEPQRGHSFLQCEVEGCDILLEMRRKKGDTLPRWMNGRSLRLEGSDHVPVFLDLRVQRLPSEGAGATGAEGSAATAAAGIGAGDACWDDWKPPPLAARFMLEIRGRQQSLRSLLSSSNSNGSAPTSLPPSRSLPSLPSFPESLPASHLPTTDATDAGPSAAAAAGAGGTTGQAAGSSLGTAVGEPRGALRALGLASGAARQQRKRPRGSGGSGTARDQSQLQRFFRPTSRTIEVQEPQSAGAPQEALLDNDSWAREGALPGGCASQDSVSMPSLEGLPGGSGGASWNGPIEMCSAPDTIEELSDEGGIMSDCPASGSAPGVLESSGPGHLSHSSRDDSRSELEPLHSSSAGRGAPPSSSASQWMHIRRRMQEALPKCKGHREACVFRVVKKAGPSIGRGFYVCARAKGPESNPEARCDHFQWAAGAGAQNGRSRPKS